MNLISSTMTFRKLLKTTAFLIAMSAFAGQVSADPSSPTGSEIGTEPSVAIIEVYTDGFVAPASADYTRSIAFSMASTGQYAVMGREEVGNRFRSVLITPSKRLQAEHLNAIEQMVREGDQLVYTDPKAAVDVLGKARSQLESIVEGLAANQKLRKEFLKTQMLLARSHLDTGNEVKAGAILREVIRVYGDKLKVTEKRYHPRLVKLYRHELKAMAGERKAVMTVATTVPGCKTMMDGRVLRGRTPHEYRRLYPGVHHVQVRCGSTESMIRKVYLNKGRPVHLMVDVDFENALTVEGGRLGLTFKTQEEVERLLVPYAVRFGSLVNADLVVAHGFLDRGTRAALKARLINVKTDAMVKEASVPAKTDVVTPSSVRRLVQLLTGREKFEVAQPRTYPVGEVPWYKNYWAWTSTAIAVGGIVAGGVLLDSYFGHRLNAT
ncbi:MAG: hypothetical protein GXP54_05795, partial [Deltaproteobacteria bacterium]|nr:hypothetical protein [Deltaproteobacteria bacterium]